MAQAVQYALNQWETLVGRTAAILASFTSTCHRHEIDPQPYLTQLLTNLPGTKVSDLDQWLPDEWKRRDQPPP